MDDRAVLQIEFIQTINYIFKKHESPVIRSGGSDHAEALAQSDRAPFSERGGPGFESPAPFEFLDLRQFLCLSGQIGCGSSRPGLSPNKREPRNW